MEARGTQGWPGGPRGKPGVPQGALGTFSLAFPSLGAPGLQKKSEKIVFCFPYLLEALQTESERESRPQHKVVSLGGTCLATLQKGFINNWLFFGGRPGGPKAREGEPRAPWGTPGFPLGRPGPPWVPLAFPLGETTQTAFRDHFKAPRDHLMLRPGLPVWGL